MTGVHVGFEGLHSSGKSTILAAVVGALRDRSVAVTTTASNTSINVGGLITRWKIENRLQPEEMVLLEAADHSRRWFETIEPALSVGRLVIADRSPYTTVARGLLRSVRRELLDAALPSARRPSVVVYVDCDVEVTLQRRVTRGMSIGGHLSGSDYRVQVGDVTDFRTEQRRLHETYAGILPATTVGVSGQGRLADAVELVLSELSALIERA